MDDLWQWTWLYHFLVPLPVWTLLQAPIGLSWSSLTFSVQVAASIGSPGGDGFSCSLLLWGFIFYSSPSHRPGVSKNSWTHFSECEYGRKWQQIPLSWDLLVLWSCCCLSQFLVLVLLCYTASLWKTICSIMNNKLVEHKGRTNVRLWHRPCIQGPSTKCNSEWKQKLPQSCIFRKNVCWLWIHLYSWYPPV